MAVICTPLPSAAFTMVRNCWLRDPRLSYKAKGLLAYLLSHAEGYRISQAQIIREATDGRESVSAGLRELEVAGYLSRVPARSAGRFAEDDYAMADPFDSAGHLITAGGAENPHPLSEIRTLPARGVRETHQSGFPASGKPQRETLPLEEQGEKNTTQPPQPPAPQGEQATAEALFDRFWDAYPRKSGKEAARRAWAKATRKADPDRIITAVKGYRFSTDMQYVKLPASWLNAGCWDDDPAALVASSNGHRSEPYRNPAPGSYTYGNGKF